jgi:RND family efflux transporter MFP subunit
MNSTASAPQPAAPQPTPTRWGRVILVCVILVVIGLLIGLVPRWLARRELLAATQADEVVTVAVTSPVPGITNSSTPFPAEVEAYVSASIHARASGYLKKWYADIGDVVTNGQLLAEIETPELDQQLSQARAEVDQNKAQLDLAHTTSDRWQTLLKTASVSEQETAEKQADFNLKQADMEAAQANLQRLEELKNYDRVTAPFNGTVTVRNTDIGQLISENSGPELFHLAQVDPLRVYVRVPQPLVHAIQPGQKAELTFQELQGRVFEATVTRSAGAVDSASRTLQVELQVPNPNGDILAGSYAQVRFQEAAGTPPLTISDNALIFRKDGTQMAVVDDNNKVHLVTVTLGRDYGNVLEVLDGLKASDKVILNPPDAIAEGMTVQIAQPTEGSPAK